MSLVNQSNRLIAILLQSLLYKKKNRRFSYDQKKKISITFPMDPLLNTQKNWDF